MNLISKIYIDIYKVVKTSFISNLNDNTLNISEIRNEAIKLAKEDFVLSKYYRNQKEDFVFTLNKVLDYVIDSLDDYSLISSKEGDLIKLKHFCNETIIRNELKAYMS